MKKVLSILILATIVSVASAQSISFQQGKKANKKAYAPMAIKILPSDSDGQFIMVDPLGRANVINVRLVDGNWKEIKHTEISNTSDYSIEKSFINGNNIHLMLTNYEKGGFSARHISLDKSSFKILSDSVLLNIELSKGDELYYWTASSLEKNFYGFVYAVYSKKTNMVSTKAILYDADMKKLCSEPLKNQGVHQMLVTENGEIVTATLVGSVFSINVLDLEGSKAGSFSVKENVEQVSLLGYTDGKVVLTALESDGNGDKRKFSGFHAYQYDLEVDKLVVNNSHNFTESEICVFLNEDVKSKANSNSVDRIFCKDNLPTHDGGAVVYQRTWTSSIRDMSTGMTSDNTVSMGLLMVKVNNNGEIVWTRGIMQNNQNAGSSIVGPLLFSNGDNIYLLTNESKDEDDVYDPTKPAKRSKSLIFANYALSIYGFSPDGNGFKKMLEKDEKTMILGPLFNIGKDKFCLFTGTLFPKISTISF